MSTIPKAPVVPRERIPTPKFAGKPTAEIIDFDLERLIRISEKIALRLDREHPGTAPLSPRVEEIVQAVAGFYRISVRDIISPRRMKEFVLPRQIAMYLARTVTLRSLPEIGRRMGGRDHTTCLHAVRKIEQLRQTDARLNDEIQLLIMHLHQRFQPPADRVQV